MLRFSSEDYSLQQGLQAHPEEQAIAITVDGPHSGGKTTVIEDYLANKELLKDESVGDFGTKHGFRYPFRYVQERLGDLIVPIVVVSEAAQSYDAMHPDEQALTSGYNRVSQATITMHAMINTQMGAGMATHLARKLQPNQPHTISAVISDRAPLSGFVYADTRLPEEDHDIVDLSEISDIPTPSYEINLRQQISEFMGFFDLVLIPDHTEVDLEDNGLRELDLEFRDQIAQQVVATYLNHMPANKIKPLNGDREQRRQTFERRIQDTLRAHPAYIR